MDSLGPGMLEPSLSRESSFSAPCALLCTLPSLGSSSRRIGHDGSSTCRSCVSPPWWHWPFCSSRERVQRGSRGPWPELNSSRSSTPAARSGKCSGPRPPTTVRDKRDDPKNLHHHPL